MRTTKIRKAIIGTILAATISTGAITASAPSAHALYGGGAKRCSMIKIMANLINGVNPNFCDY